uniref:Uncharacterized protein n=1 Tax=Globodera rostochiensis TaxID=31243 RepID=A0A914I6T7_GLORO
MQQRRKFKQHVLAKRHPGRLISKKNEKREPDELENKNKKEGVGVRKKELSDAQSGRPGVAHGMTKVLVTSEDGHRVHGTVRSLARTVE